MSIHKAFPYLVYLLLFSSCKSLSVKTYIQAEGSAWNLSLCKNAVQTDQKVYYGTFEGKICGLNLTTQKTIFSYPAKAFPFSITTVDLNHDGSEEIIAATAEGELLAIDAKGKLLWTFKTKLPLYSVDAGDIIPGGNLEIVTGGIDRALYVLDDQGNLLHKYLNANRLIHRIAVGNLDQDEAEEILMIENRNTAQIINFEGGKLKAKKREKLSLPEHFKNWENPRGSIFVFDLKLADLNQDKIDEIIVGDSYFNKQIIAVLDTSLSPQWISDQTPFFSFHQEPDLFSEFYATALVEVIEAHPDHPGLEIVAVTGGLIRMYSAQGEKLGESYAKVGFTDVLAHQDKLLLGSSPNGDNTLYVIDLSKDWEAQVAAIQRKGKAKKIENNLMQLRQQVFDYAMPTDTLSQQKYTIQLGGVSPKTEKLFLKRRDWMQKTFPYPSFQYGASMRLMESSPPLNPAGNPWDLDRWRVDAVHGTMSQAEIMKSVAWVESRRIPTIFYIGHSCMPFISLSTAEKVLQTAPQYCLGFQTNEDEQIERIPQYFEHFYKPLSNLCVHYGNKWNLTKNKGVWWVSSPALPSVHEALFKEGRHRCLVASTEDSNSRTPGLNILGRSGLWLAGLTEHIFINTNSDLFSFNRFFQWEYPKHGHPYLRRLVAHTLLGGAMYHIRHMDKMETDSGFAFSQMGKESTEIFFHLLGKGLVFKPKRHQVRGFNPIGFVVHPPPSSWLEDAHNGHSPEKWQEDQGLHQAVISHIGSLWGLSNTPKYSLERILFHKQRQFGDHIPATPYGLIAFVPVQTDLEKVAGISDWWHTDGVYIWKEEGSTKYTGKEAAEILQKDFENSSQKLPFTYQGDDIFLQTVQMSQDTYRLYLIDPGWLDPHQRNVRIISNLDEKVRLRDIFTGQEMKTNADNSFEVQVPMGSLRILEATRQHN